MKATRFKKGHAGYKSWLGKKFSDKHREKLREAKLGGKHKITLKEFQFKGVTAHWNWHGGKSPESIRLRNSKEYKKWRTAVYRRDNYTCVFCGKRGGWNSVLKRRILLEADHIKQWAFFPSLRFVVSNGRTLCKPCYRTLPIIKSLWKKSS